MAATAPAPHRSLRRRVLVTDRSALGHSLRPLARDGFVRLEQREHDRRLQHVVLTRAGKAIFIRIGRDERFADSI